MVQKVGEGSDFADYGRDEDALVAEQVGADLDRALARRQEGRQTDDAEVPLVSREVVVGIVDKVVDLRGGRPEGDDFRIK